MNSVIISLLRDFSACRSPSSSLESLTAPIEELNQRPLDILASCPSLSLLIERVKQRPLSSDDTQLAMDFSFELSQIKSIGRLILSTSMIPNVNRRILLHDGEQLQIRVHLFDKGAKETFIHDHQSSFISICLRGTYMHRLHQIVDDGGQHFVIHRSSGGNYSDPKMADGSLVDAFAHRYQAGQFYFISAIARHTVEPLSDDSVVTIVIRDKRQLRPISSAVHTSRDFSAFSTEAVVPNTDSSAIDAISRELESVLSNYQHQYEPSSKDSLAISHHRISSPLLTPFHHHIIRFPQEMELTNLSISLNDLKRIFVFSMLIMILLQICIIFFVINR